jgi:hypothetical protein
MNQINHQSINKLRQPRYSVTYVRRDGTFSSCNDLSVRIFLPRSATSFHHLSHTKKSRKQLSTCVNNTKNVQSKVKHMEKQDFQFDKAGRLSAEDEQMMARTSMEIRSSLTGESVSSIKTCRQSYCGTSWIRNLVRWNEREYKRIAPGLAWVEPFACRYG